MHTYYIECALYGVYQQPAYRCWWCVKQAKIINVLIYCNGEVNKRSYIYMYGSIYICAFELTLYRTKTHQYEVNCICVVVGSWLWLLTMELCCSLTHTQSHAQSMVAFNSWCLSMVLILHLYIHRCMRCNTWIHNPFHTTSRFMKSLTSAYWLPLSLPPCEWIWLRAD